MSPSSLSSRVIKYVAAVAAVAALPVTGFAADRLWDGDTSNEWAADNFVGTVTTNANNGAVFYTGTPTFLNPTVSAANVTTAYMIFNSAADSNMAFTIGDGVTARVLRLQSGVANSGAGSGSLPVQNGAIIVDAGAVGTFSIGATSNARLLLGASTDSGATTYLFTNNNSANTFTISAPVAADLSNTNGTTRAMQFGGAGNWTISGEISQVAGNGATTFTTPISISKSGAGVLTLSGSNSYTGATTVSAGTLLINGNSSSATGAVTVAANAILGGNGTIGGSTTIQNDGILTPGQTNAAGTLTVTNSLSLNQESVLDWDISIADYTIGGGINDLVTGVTNLTLDGTINFSLLGGSQITSEGTWRLVNYSGTLGNNTLLIGSLNLASGLSASIDTSIAGQVNLVVAVPEPSSLLLLLGGAVLVGFRRRNLRP